MNRLRRELVGWLPVIEYCAEECRRQHVGPLHVGYMVDAWRIGMQHEGPITNDLIVKLGFTIEPYRNRIDGYRQVGVRVGDEIKADPIEVPRLMKQLVDTIIVQDDGRWFSVLKPAEFYLEFENIHPFVDGNGRTGKVLFNLLNGTLAAPEWPPNFWGISNP